MVKTKKRCFKCLENKKLNKFYKNKNSKDGLTNQCKICKDKQHKKYYINNKKEISKYKKGYKQKNKEKITIQDKKYHKLNKKKISEKGKIYRENNKEKISKRRKIYRKNNKKKRNEYERTRKKNDIKYHILSVLRTQIWSVLKGVNKSKNTIKLLNCSIKFFLKYIESQFTKGMNWENYGVYGWHIDHIKPCSLFDLTDPKQQRECFHYTNLQPLWAEDNLAKGAKY